MYAPLIEVSLPASMEWLLDSCPQPVEKKIAELLVLGVPADCCTSTTILRGHAWAKLGAFCHMGMHEAMHIGTMDIAEQLQSATALV